jgi:hypothetical protein
MGERSGSRDRTRPGLRGAWVAMAAALFIGTPFLAPTCCGLGSFAADVAGDCNSDVTFDISDSVYLLAFLFIGGEIPDCRARCDFRADGVVELTDAIAMTEFLFKGGDMRAPLPEGACDGNIELVWDPVTRDALGGEEEVGGYRVYVRERFPDESLSIRMKIAEVGPDCACIDLTSADLSSLAAGRTYLFSVTAVDTTGNESDFSADLEITKRL